jgi:tetratricopeptide (TPR) repeat protein
MKLFYSLLFTALTCLVINAQNPVETIVMEGIEYHGEGDYDKAIETYRKALELEPNSPLVFYEIAYSYFEKKDYENAIAYADKVLVQNGEHMQAAYMVKGSALELTGRHKESNALFEKAIRETGEHHLLYFNLGINYFRADDMINSEKNILKALETNFHHTSSHLTLANIHRQLNNPTKALLASHFFLFLEPNTFRSEEAYEILTGAMSGNVSHDDDKPNTVNINFTPNENDPFSTASLMLSLLEASKSSEKNVGKSEAQLFTENTGSIFKILGELNRENYEDIWWSYYIPFFYEIALSDHLEAYCMYIIYNFDDDAFNWLTENEDKLDAFSQWFDE